MVDNKDGHVEAPASIDDQANRQLAVLAEEARVATEHVAFIDRQVTALQSRIDHLQESVVAMRGNLTEGRQLLKAWVLDQVRKGEPVTGALTRAFAVSSDRNVNDLSPRRIAAIEREALHLAGIQEGDAVVVRAHGGLLAAATVASKVGITPVGFNIWLRPVAPGGEVTEGIILANPLVDGEPSNRYRPLRRIVTRDEFAEAVMAAETPEEAAAWVLALAEHGIKLEDTGLPAATVDSIEHGLLEAVRAHRQGSQTDPRLVRALFARSAQKGNDDPSQLAEALVEELARGVAEFMTTHSGVEALAIRWSSVLTTKVQAILVARYGRSYANQEDEELLTRIMDQAARIKAQQAAR